MDFENKHKSYEDYLEQTCQLKNKLFSLGDHGNDQGKASGPEMEDKALEDYLERVSQLESTLLSWQDYGGCQDKVSDLDFVLLQSMSSKVIATA